MRFLRRIQYVFRQRRYAAELAEEMEFHHQMAEREQQEAGLTAEEAHYAAHRRMGNSLHAREDARGVWLTPWIESVGQDLRYAARSLVRQPGFTLLALLALGLGIGLNTSLFTVFNAVALRPWPVRDPQRVVNVLATSPQFYSGYGGFTVPEYRHLSENSHALAGAILIDRERVSLDRQSDGPHSNCYFVSGNYFSVLGVDMAIGRGFAPDEDNVGSPQAVAVLSYGTWQTRYGGDTRILGRLVRVNEIPFTVVGVTDEDFTGTTPDSHDLWVPLAALLLAHPKDEGVRAMLTDPHHCCASMGVAGRLAPGVTQAQAQAELNTLAQAYVAQYHEQAHQVVVTGTTFFGRPDAKPKIILTMVLFMSAVGSVLLLACANVSNLLLARASARQREIALRLTLGAGRGRIVRQLLTESLLLAFLAGGAGLALAYLLPGVLIRKVSPDHLFARLQPDSTVAAYAVGIAVLSAVAFGLAPALRCTRASVSEAMKEQSAHVSPRFPLRGLLLGVQVAISVVLLAAAGLLVRGLQHAYTHDPGFIVSGVTLISVDLPENRYDETQGQSWFAELVKRLEPLAEGGAVGLAALPPLASGRMLSEFRLADSETRNPISLQRVSAGYFDVLGIPVVSGRNFVPADSDRNSILVNEAMARRYWPSGGPVGRAIITGRDRREVVGVVRDAELFGFGPVEPTFFEPYGGERHGVVLLRGRMNSEAARNQAAPLVAALEPAAVTNVSSLVEQMGRWLGPSKAGAELAASLGLLALVLASVGVYGVIAYSVEQRRREIGVRLALGARPGEIVRFILRANARGVLGGLAVGAGASFLVARLLRSTLPDVSGFDPLVWAAILGLLLAAGIAASAVPASRAARLDPLTALHHE